MKKLQNPPKEFEQHYAAISEMYTAYKGLTDLAVSPSGSLQSYASSVREKAGKFMEYREKLDNLLPPQPGS